MDKPIDTLLDRIPTESLKISVSKRPDIPAPEQRVESFEVEGRHGSLTRLGKFKDIPFSIEYNILEMENIKPQLRKIRGFFHGKKTLKFSDDDVYYKIKSLKIGQTNNEIEQYGLFTVDFVCDPFQYAITDTRTVTTTPTVINNPGTQESEPILKLYGSGDVTITINGKSFSVLNLADYVIINSELLESYRENVSWNNYMIGDFPIFEVGENTISWTGTITKIEIDPGWRYK